MGAGTTNGRRPRGVGGSGAGGSGLAARALDLLDRLESPALAYLRGGSWTFGRLGYLGAVLGDPPLYVLGVPHLAHAQLVRGFGEVGPREELLDTLTAQPAESFTDLGGAHEVVHGRDHKHKTSGHLTSGQWSAKISHVTSGVDLPIRTLPAHETCQHKNYLLTCDQYEELIARAGNRCEICRLPAEQNHLGKLHIDHSGGAWAVRGLLCNTCNTCLDRPSMDPEIRAAYLANAWYIGMLADLGFTLDRYPEPPIGTTVYARTHCGWRRTDRGWLVLYGRRRKPPRYVSWARLICDYGPHNLRVAGGHPSTLTNLLAADGGTA